MASIDFAIVTGLVEEFGYLKALFPGLRSVGEGADEWHRARVTSKDKSRSYEVVLGCATDMGPEHMLLLTQRVIKQWDPAHIVLVGIAARFDQDISLGDIIVSQQVFYYNPAKATIEGIKYRPQGYPCGLTLIRQAEFFRTDEVALGEWRSQAAKTAEIEADKLVADPPKSPVSAPAIDLDAAQAELRSHVPKIFYGTLASGSWVIDAPAKQKELLALHGKILGAEMEGAGMMLAVWDAETPPSAVVIKGISDYADGKKSQQDVKKYWRLLATENSFRMALGIMLRGRIRPLNADKFQLKPTAGSVMEARQVIPKKSVGCANLCFPQLVIPGGPITALELEFVVHGADGQVLPLLDARVRYFGRLDQEATVEEVKDRYSWSIGWPKAPIRSDPIGLYLLVEGTPAKVGFIVRDSAGNKKTATWTPSGEA
jgi:nucleoside phosphorylase